MLSNDNNGSAINVCIDDKQVTQLGNISSLQPIKITLTMENKKLLDINLNFDGTAAQGKGEETNQESPNPTVTTQSYNSHSQRVTPVTVTNTSKECAIQPNVGADIIEYSFDLNNYYKLTNSNSNNSARSMSSISSIGRYRNGNRSMRSMRSNKSNKSNNYDQSVSVQLYSPMNPNNMPKFEPTSKLIAALPDITNKFDALFPFYRLKDKDCKLLSQFVFDHIDSICKIFCDANGRWLNTKIYFVDSIDIKNNNNNNNNNSKYKSIKYKRMSFYNDVATETEIKEWRNIEMNDKYCYIEAKNAKLKYSSNLKNNKSNNNNNNNNNNVNSNNNINNSNNKKRNSLLGIQKL